jgi:tRNA A-37 threonylcarbamoyl transferase component Bud32
MAFQHENFAGWFVQMSRFFAQRPQSGEVVRLIEVDLGVSQPKIRLPSALSVFSVLVAELLTVMLLSSSALFAQRYPVVPVAGAPHGIFTMMQDSQSRIWMGTIDDVFCFDGVHFYSLRQDGFPKEFPNSFGEDDDGAIWIATQGTDATGGTGRGSLYRYQKGHVDKLFSGDGLSVINAGRATMLVSFGTEAQGHPTYGDLYRFQRRGKTWIADRLLEGRVDHMTVDAHGTVLFPCPVGWCEIARQAILEWEQGAKLALQEHAGNTMVEKVLRDRFGCVWFRAEATASYQCPDTPSVVTISNAIFAYDDSAHIEEAPDGSVFMMVSMTLGRPGNFHTANIRNGLPANMDTAMVARDGTIWIGADSGLYRFMYPFRLEYWNQDTGLERVNSLLKIGDSVFAGSTGIQVLNKDRRTWSTLPDTEQLKGVGSVAAGPAGTIFAASASGVTQLRTDGTIIARTGFEDGGTNLAATKDGQLWLGSGLNKKAGIRRVSQNGNRLALTSENLPMESSADLSYDQQSDTLWACNGNDLVFRRDGMWQHVTKKDGLLDFNCRTVVAHPNGDVWLGYENSRLSLVRDALSGRPNITNYSVKSDRLVANSQNQFLGIDLRGWIWRGSDAVYVANSKAAESGEWLALDEQDGLPIPGANENSFLSDADSSIWFASGATVMHFSPRNDFATAFPSPQVFVSGFSFGSDAPRLADTIASIPHGSDLLVHVGSLQFDRRNALQLRYRLLPEQSAWNSQRELDVRLGRLSSGSHTLEVQAQLGSGPWSTTVAKSFTVLRPFWLSWPAIAGFLFTGGLGAAGAYRRHKTRAERASKKLPALEEWRLSALSPETSLLAGTVLDSRFEVGHVLARGGFAAIAKGKDLQQGGRPCAVKIFRQELMDKDWMTRRFQQEVLALEKINHPNVVRIYGHGTTPVGSKYLVMEFVEGQTLREELGNGALTPRQTASYVSQTGNALEEIHGRRICHRDLKPENLMIRNAGPEGQDLVLIDFSIAIVQDPDETLHGLSRAAGTLYYMAPEQSIGYADSSTDIYSLAKIVIEMLTGQRLSTLLPDASMDLPDRVREFLAGLNLGLSAASVELMSSALEFDPSRRPKSASAFANQIGKDLAAVPDRV